MVNSNGPAEKFGFSFPSSSNLDSMSWKELMEAGENGGGSLTDSVRKLYLHNTTVGNQIRFSLGLESLRGMKKGKAGDKKGSRLGCIQKINVTMHSR